MQVYADAELLKNEGDVLRDAERAFGVARRMPLGAFPDIEAASDLVWDEVQVPAPHMLPPADAALSTPVAHRPAGSRASIGSCTHASAGADRDLSRHLRGPLGAVGTARRLVRWLIP